MTKKADIPDSMISSKLLIHLTINWPVLIGAVMACAVIAGVIGRFLPADYSATASLLIDQNVTEAFDTSNLEAEATYLSRETEKLEALAYSDEVWDDVRTRMAAQGWEDLPDENAALFSWVRNPHPMDGVWQFVVTHPDQTFAMDLSASWMDSFYALIQSGLEAAAHVERITNELAALEEDIDATQGKILLAAEIDRALEDAGNRSLDEQRLAYATALLNLADMSEPMDVPLDPPDDALAEAIRLFREGLMVRVAAWEDLITLLEQEQSGLLDEVEQLDAGGAGISPYLEVTRLQDAVVRDARVENMGAMAAMGAVLGALAYLVWFARRVYAKGGAI